MIGEPATVTLPPHSVEPSGRSENWIASAVRYALGVTVSLSSYLPALSPLMMEGAVSTVMNEIACLSGHTVYSTFVPPWVTSTLDRS